jgi:hypothetical protein
MIFIVMNIKMENNIPTAEDFLKDLQSEYEETGEYKMYFAIDIPNKLREFAELHVRAALERAIDNVDYWYDYDGHGYIDHDTIRNSYPPENIK